MPLLPSPIQEIHDPLFERKGLQVFVKREDLIHPVIMGNKWRKLKYNLEKARHQGCSGIVTMGGAFSNHILATAAAASENNLSSTGIIRGEELNPDSNPTLKNAAAFGMQFDFISRERYKCIREHPEQVKEMHPEAYFLPEGGTNDLAIRGCSELIEEIDMDFDFICTPVGTGGTFAGIVKALDPQRHAIGVSALKGGFIHENIRELFSEQQVSKENYILLDQYHFGGYAKSTDELIDFILDFKGKYGVLLDPVYTGKLFYGVIDLIRKDFFKFNHRIILIHTGGIQGIEGYNLKSKRKIR